MRIGWLKCYSPKLKYWLGCWKRSQESGVRRQGVHVEIQVPAKSFLDLTLWQKAHRFVLDVYRFTAGFPRTEMYGLSAQFRRSAVSIPANIAEGFRKSGKSDKIRFLNIAQGSLEESRYYLILSRDLGYGAIDHLWNLLEEVSKILEAYSTAIQKNRN
mgnify:CR=1 FL=1|uniref:Four helix bundle protein n=1 Tax=Desulfatirhabdium butyrativorans TaxID=340467 RepID=A0A7C4VSQ5_9BACT